MSLPDSPHAFADSRAPNPSAHSDREQRPEDRVQCFINNILATAVDELMRPDGRPAISLRRRSSRGDYFIDASNGALQAGGPDVHITYSWPGKNAYEAWRFTISLRVLGIISDAIRADIITSKRLEGELVSHNYLLPISKNQDSQRDIYYNDPVYFGSQRVVDTLVDDIAYTIGVDRAALHVTAAAKGLTSGNFRLKMKSEKILDIGSSFEDILIPQPEGIKEIIMPEIKWVLIVEKEAIFRRLARNHYHLSSAAGKGILITGKGYPDLSTRAFVRLLSDTKSPSGFQTAPHFYALVDSDPDGMAIMSTYKYGSMAQAHENARLNAPTIQWLGLRTSDVVAGADPRGEDALMPLSARDRKKALAMLNSSPAFAENGPEPRWRAELQQMLMLNLKAEIEVLYDRDGGLEGWIDQKLMVKC